MGGVILERKKSQKVEGEGGWWRVFFQPSTAPAILFYIFLYILYIYYIYIIYIYIYKWRVWRVWRVLPS
jgi:hypothetical protein